MQETIKELIIERAREHGDKTFLHWEDEEVSYAKLLDISRSISGGLARTGLSKDDKVCILSYNRPEFIYMMLGCAFSGTVLVPINTQFKAEEAAHIIRDSDARVVISQPEFAGLIERVRPECPGLEQVIMLDEALPGSAPFQELYCPEGAVEQDIEEDDAAAIIYTSGTTGHLKGVMLTHKNYVFNAWEITEAARMSEEDRFMCILPLFHVNGQVVTVYAPLYAGASMVLLKGFSPKEFLPRLEQYKATAFSGVPTVYAILNNLPDAESYDLSPLRFCICGAAPMPVDVFETFEKKYNAFILEGYGLSEGTCASSLNPLDGKRKVGSIGVPLRGQEMMISDGRGEECSLGEVGEVLVRGDNVMKGYYKNPGATADTLKSGWLYTGDLGYKDDEGYFFIVGRKKEMIIRGGENIYPREVEEALYKHPGIMDAAVVGIPDKIWGEEVAAFVVPRPGHGLRASEIIDYLKETLANYKCPRMVFFWEELPKTVTGKVQKDKVVEQHLRTRQG